MRSRKPNVPMNSQRKQSNDAAPFLLRLREAIQVGLGLFLFCTVSMLGIAAIAWLVSVAMDPHHSGVKAALEIVRFSRIPLGVTTGLAIFFAAVSWRSTEPGNEPSNIQVDRRRVATGRGTGIDRRRKISKLRAPNPAPLKLVT